MSHGQLFEQTEISSSPLGLDDHDNDKGPEWTVNDGLRVYFVTIRLRVDISPECVSYIMEMLEKHKQYEQMLLCVEKENAAGPCTHHMHALVHFKQNIPKPTLKRLLDRWVLKFCMKDEGALKHDYATKAAIDVRTCYCVKEDYLSKHITSSHYVGLDEFDIDSATAALPDKGQQTSLQTTKSDRVINAVWASYSALWLMTTLSDQLGPGTTTLPTQVLLSVCQHSQVDAVRGTTPTVQNR